MTDNSFNPLPFYTAPSLRNACKLECKSESCGFYISVGATLNPFIFCTDLLGDPFVKQIKLFKEGDALPFDTLDIRIDSYDCEGKTYVYSNMDLIDLAFNLDNVKWSGTGDLGTVGQATLDPLEHIFTTTTLTENKSYKIHYNSNGPSGDYEIFLTDDTGALPVTQSIFDGNATGLQVKSFVPGAPLLSLVFRYKTGPIDTFIITNLSVTCPWDTDDIICGTKGFITIETDAVSEVTFYSELFVSKLQDNLDCESNKFSFQNTCDIECWNLSLMDAMCIYLPECAQKGVSEGHATIIKPIYPTVIDGGESEENVFVKEFEMVEKTRNVVFSLIPEYLIDLVNNLPFFETLTITRTGINITSLESEISGDPAWQDNGCFGEVTLRVVENRITQTGCCDCGTVVGGGGD